MLDHALLHPTLTDDEVDAQIRSLTGHPLASFCVKPCHVRHCADLLRGSAIRVGTVVGFPHGVTTTATKTSEAHTAFADGAHEVDMVINTGKALGGLWEDVADDITAVLAVVREYNGLLKVIFETDFLPEDTTKIRLCALCSELGVDYVKTSTGFGFVKQTDGRSAYVGATDHDIRLMRRHCRPSIGVKPSGGVKTLDDVLRFYKLGATRFGTTSSHAILAAARERFDEEMPDDSAAPHGDRQLEY